MCTIHLSVYLNDTAFMNGAHVIKRTIEFNPGVQVDFDLLINALRILFGGAIVITFNIFTK